MGGGDPDAGKELWRVNLAAKSPRVYPEVTYALDFFPVNAERVIGFPHPPLKGRLP
jgi:hypothetical protein